MTSSLSATEAGAPTIVVEDRRNCRDWSSLGCVAALEEDFTRDQLVEVLDRHARVVDRTVHRPVARTDLADDPAPGRMVGVTGTGGSGASTVAMALAQAVAPTSGRVALVDGARRADLALYHDVGDVIPGLPELVDLQRRDRSDPEEVRSLLFGIDDRGYDLLLGLRRSRDWAGLRPHAVDAASSPSGVPTTWWSWTTTPMWREKRRPARWTSRTATQWPAPW